jgi:hypothetical protein
MWPLPITRDSRNVISLAGSHSVYLPPTKRRPFLPLTSQTKLVLIYNPPSLEGRIDCNQAAPPCECRNFVAPWQADRQTERTVATLAYATRPLIINFVPPYHLTSWHVNLAFTFTFTFNNRCREWPRPCSKAICYKL